MAFIRRGVGAVLLCAASWSHAYDLEAFDDRAVMGVMRSAWRVWPVGNRVGGVELSYEYYSGSGSQRLEAGDPQTVDGQTLSAPDTLHHKVAARRLTLAYVHQFPIGRYVQVEPGVGLGVEQTDWSTRSAATTAALSPHVPVTPVLHVGVNARLILSDRLALEGRASFGHRVPYRFGIGAELAWVVRLSHNTAFRFAYFFRDLEVSGDGHVIGDSPGAKRLSVDMRGVGAGLNLDF